MEVIFLGQSVLLLQYFPYKYNKPTFRVRNDFITQNNPRQLPQLQINQRWTIFSHPPGENEMHKILRINTINFSFHEQLK